MGHNEAGTGLGCEMNLRFVVWVDQDRNPGASQMMPLGNGTERVEKPRDFLSRDLENRTLARQHFLIFGAKRVAQEESPVPCGEQSQQFAGSAGL
jgi:hypothetical protein